MTNTDRIRTRRTQVRNIDGRKVTRMVWDVTDSCGRVYTGITKHSDAVVLAR